MISVLAQKWNIDPIISNNLKANGYVNFFPVQEKVIPVMIRYSIIACAYPRDICVSAPTGSGKTLAYAIPVLNSICGRPIVRLTALILLPSRELANQVFDVFQVLAAGTGIRLCCSTGKSRFDDEQLFLTGRSLPKALSPLEYLFSNRDLYETVEGKFSETSGASILICTPGRLLEHLQNTPGFTLEYLEYLILDEADRLLGNN